MSKQPSDPTYHLPKIVKILLCILGGFLIISLLLMARFWAVEHTKAEVLGVSFSQVQAERYGSDWRNNYTALIDELGFRHLRVAAYWDRIQPSPNSYDFSEIDYMIAEAKKRNAKITLVVGQKVIRVPECYYPAWLNKEDPELVKTKANEMLKTVVERYKDEPTIEAWQVENEFLLKNFGDCPGQNLTREALATEIDTVKSIDTSRPIIITQSDQLGFPVRGSLGSIYGFSMYRWVWGPFGYFRYPQSGIFNFWKAAIVSTVFGQEVKVHELQAEPWDKVGNENLEIKRSKQTMNPRIFFENLEYARQTQMKRIDLWGSEWWYATKNQGNSEMWETIKNLEK